MAQATQKNWLVVRQVYGEYLDVPIEDKGKTCEFHWKGSLHKHIEEHILPQFKALITKCVTIGKIRNLCKMLKRIFFVFKGGGLLLVL